MSIVIVIGIAIFLLMASLRQILSSVSQFFITSSDRFAYTLSLESLLENKIGFVLALFVGNVLGIMSRFIDPD